MKKKLDPTSERPRKWTGKVLDTTDASGDLILELPNGLLKSAGWKIGDQLEFVLGDQGETILRKCDA